SHVVMRDDGRILLEERIPARVILVIVRVDDEPHGFVRDPLQGCSNLLCQGSVLIVYYDDPVLADGSANVAAGALQHINVAGDPCELNLNFAEVLILGGRQTAGQQNGSGESNLAHRILLPLSTCRFTLSVFRLPTLA